MVFDNVRKLIDLLGYKEYTYFTLPLLWNDELIFYVLTRAFTATLGALTVIPVYLTAKKMFGQRAGWLAGLALAITPFHVWHSHYSLADVPMTFFLAWALYFISIILFKRHWIDYLLAGLFIGLTASTKYNGALMAGGLMLAHLIRVFSEQHEKLLDVDSWQHLFLAGFGSVVGFVAGTPFAVLDYFTFIRTDSAKGALWQFTNVGSVTLAEQLKQFLQVVVSKLPENLGYTLFVLFAAAFVYVVVNMLRNKKLWVNKDLLFFTILGMGLIFYIAGLEKTRAHYFFIAYPAVIIGGIGYLVQQLDKVKSRSKNLLWAVVFIIPLYLSLANAYAFYQTDTRVAFYRWLLQNKDRVSKMYVLDQDLRPVLERSGMDVSTEEFVPGKVEQSALVVGTQNKEQELNEVIEFEGGPYNRGPDIYVYTP